MDEQKREVVKSVDASQSRGGVAFGIRGCLTALIGFILGTLIGFGLTVWLIVGFDYKRAGDQDVLGEALIFGFIFWASGSTLGTLIGIIVGSKRR